jgi:hypothetical protein
MSDDTYIKELEARVEELGATLDMYEKFTCKLFENGLLRVAELKKPTENTKQALILVANSKEFYTRFGYSSPQNVYINAEYEALLRKTLPEFIIFDKQGKKQLCPILKKSKK